MQIFRMFIPLVLISFPLQAHLPSKEDTILYREELNRLFADEKISGPECITIPEGDFVYAFHPEVASWIQKPFDREIIRAIKKSLSPHLEISLTKEGFSSASTRRSEEEEDRTNYSAIWVRDCAWHYFGLKLQNRKRAGQLIAQLLEFYTTKEQISRFLAIIQKPEIADPKRNPNAFMEVPLIRFSSKTLSHQQIDGKNQPWNHIQFDSHGLFLLALADALEEGIFLCEDLLPKHLKLLTLFPAFFSAVQYERKPDAGPWEEELLLNASSAGLIASGLKRISLVLEKLDRSPMPAKEVDILYWKGILRTEKNLSMGGEAPDLKGNSLDRGADIALLFLCTLEHAPYYNHPDRIKQILQLNQSLIGPYGIYRYRFDAYQAANYWTCYSLPSRIFGVEHPKRGFLNRFNKGYMPHNQPHDAQWFFDSVFAIAYYRLARLEKESLYYLRKGDLHLKRALGQITGPNAYAANGEKLPEWSLPESINTVFDENGTAYPMPSPICPLGWASAALEIALEAAEKAHRN